MAPRLAVKPGRLRHGVAAALDSARSAVEHFADSVGKASAPRTGTDAGAPPDN